MKFPNYKEILNKKLDLNADSVEFCPFDAFHNLVAVGCYQLDEVSGLRKGKIYLYSLESLKDSSLISNDEIMQLREIKKVEHIAGIFDMDWIKLNTNDNPILLTGCANGSLHLFNCSNSNDEIFEILKCDDLIDNGMLLSIDSGKYSYNDENSIYGSSSSGELFYAKIDNNDIKCEMNWKGHELEVWTIARDNWDRNVIYSGADDNKMKGWDRRQSPIKTIFTETKEHKAGVCTISSSHLRQNIIATGSYDEYLRLFDIRFINKPICISKICCNGGGVWRLKWHPYDDKRILTACMHEGFVIWEIKDASILASENLIIEKTLEYKEHNSLAYGIDWSWKRDITTVTASNNNKDYIGTCSFYDNLFSIWNYLN